MLVPLFSFLMTHTLYQHVMNRIPKLLGISLHLLRTWFNLLRIKLQFTYQLVEIYKVDL